MSISKDDRNALETVDNLNYEDLLDQFHK